MPGLVRKFLVFAAVDALFLQPHLHRSQKPVPGVQISYGHKNDIKAVSVYPKELANLPSIEAHGVVGLFTVASYSYLILITKRKQVAQVYGKPIYVISGVTIVPLASQSEAKLVVENTKQALPQGAHPLDYDTSDSEADDEEYGVSHEDDPVTPFNENKARLGHIRSKDSIAQDVISKKGAYGRFAEKWFSKKGWSAERQRSQGMSSSTDLTADVNPTNVGSENAKDGNPLSLKQDGTNDSLKDNTDLSASITSSASSVAVALVPKLLRTTRLLLNSQSFYYSYDHDLTRRLGSNSSRGTNVPLCKQVDSQFHWNSWLSEPFANAGQVQFMLPVMQGFVNQRAFTVDKQQSTISDTKESVGEVIELQEISADGREQENSRHKDFLVTLISRRSTGRPGLRYLRRGIDDGGNVANAVETEQILSDASWSPESKTYSFTQIRGSIPVFFSQSPYSFKPTPIISYSFEVNQAAFRRHFTNIVNRYGNTQVALLVDKHGTEVKIGEEYEKHAKYLNEHNGVNGKKIGFEWFDFHHACRGMKFENVSLLMDLLDDFLNNSGYAIQQNQKLLKSQLGILRTSCMDCLDRTNVVQSACGRWALQKQLQEEGLSIDLQSDTSTRWFDIMWADNGDAISKQYASTAALKGDYTRTRKRDYRGALNDFGLTLGRYYNNIVNDFFSQAAVDFLLGRVDDVVFEEFEANMMSADPGMSMSKVRQNAVDISVKIVVEDRTEELKGGWVMATPHVTNTLFSSPLEEMVLLITDAALYSVRFNWATEKVSAFERVQFEDITRVYWGTYITNTLSNFQTDAKRNVGFVVEYRAGQESNARVNTRSMSTSTGIEHERAIKAADASDSTKSAASNTLPGAPADKEQEAGVGNALKAALQTATSQAPSATRVLAFKALPSRTGVRAHFQSTYDTHQKEPNEAELVKSVCGEIARFARHPESWIEQKDVISLADAKKNTSIIESLGHSLKKLVWA